MGGPLRKDDAAKLSQLLDGLRAELERVYWRAGKRDAMEGQRLNLTVGPYRVRFKMDNDLEWGLVKWGLRGPGRQIGGDQTP